MSLKFIKIKEDFVCENCGKFINGDGYTNHCPFCLYSKHVDIFPGDRGEVCKGLMEPIGSETINGEERIIQKCLKCSKIHKNKISKKDNLDVLFEILKNKN